MTILVTAAADPIVYHVRNVLDGVEPIWVRSQQDDATASALYSRGQEQSPRWRPPIEEGQARRVVLLQGDGQELFAVVR